MLLLKYGITKPEKLSDKLKTAKDLKSSGFTSLSPTMPKSSPNLNTEKTNLVLGYFKGLNIDPITGIDLYFTNQVPKINPSNIFTLKSIIDFKYYEELRRDLFDYINSGLSNKRNVKGIGLKEKDISIGEFLPKNKDIDLIKKNKIYKTNPKNNTPSSNMNQNTNNTPPGESPSIKYSSNDDIPKGGMKGRM